MQLESTTDRDNNGVTEESETRSLARQLERAKEELDLISYLASHDLQAPIRILQRLHDELAEQPHVMENKATQAIVGKMGAEIGRSKTLLQGLLDYMRLETYGPSHSLIDANEIVEAALTVLEEQVRSTGARIAYEGLPEVYGHRGRITRLMTYLLDNALKFNKSAAPLITISAVRKGAWLEFSMQDNGISIENEYRDIIFGLFYRLHTAEEYPGHGIGLALCKKIVESHGGKIEIEPVSTGGSIFKFTLPAMPIKP